jgi:hypothetical protein
MKTRDKAIIDDLLRFRCLSRDDIAELHFPGVRQPIREANTVLLRLRRTGEISVSKERRQYVYFPQQSIKKDSTKIPHFLSIAEFYRETKRHGDHRVFEVEPKLGGKGLPEPDVFMIWKGMPWFVEVQRSVYNEKQWQEKMNRYEAYYLGGDWKEAEWQPEKKRFPYVWIIGKGRAGLQQSFKVVHGSVEEMVSRISK